MSGATGRCPGDLDRGAENPPLWCAKSASEWLHEMHVADRRTLYASHWPQTMPISTAIGEGDPTKLQYRKVKRWSESIQPFTPDSLKTMCWQVFGST